jgi:hypothetical protein
VSDLTVDTAELHRASVALVHVKTELEKANHTADDASDILGHHALASRLHDFAHDWDDRRAEMLTTIGSLGEFAGGAGDAYDQIEHDLATAISSGQHG